MKIFMLMITITLLSTTSNESFANASDEHICWKMIQNKVAWDKAGTKKRWNPTNIQTLCKNTSNPQKTVACFKSALQKSGHWHTSIQQCKQPAQIKQTHNTQSNHSKNSSPPRASFPSLSIDVNDWHSR